MAQSPGELGFGSQSGELFWVSPPLASLPTAPTEGEAGRWGEGNVSLVPACLYLPSTPGEEEAGRRGGGVMKVELTLVTILQHPPLGWRGCLPHHSYDGGKRQVAFLVSGLTDPLSGRGEGGREVLSPLGLASNWLGLAANWLGLATK